MLHKLKENILPVLIFTLFLVVGLLAGNHVRHSVQNNLYTVDAGNIAFYDTASQTVGNTSDPNGPCGCPLCCSALN